MDNIHKLLKQPDNRLDSEQSWRGVRRGIRRKKVRTYAIVATLILCTGTVIFLPTSTTGNLYSDEQFERILSLEAQLELELSSFPKPKTLENERLKELNDRLAMLNERIERIRIEIQANPKNPNYHRTYLAMLKTKRKILTTLNKRG